ncbi:MAG: DUF599 family protein [Betaproteobacteria bacterium]|nr:DUF599 family protein [Betaproteobacteria bacterium]MBI3057212.1 DUF599 family protein [Betaproteobacteria bacterium]
MLSIRTTYRECYSYYFKRIFCISTYISGKRDIDRLALIIGFANGNFNNGLRAYYFGVAALSWFLHPVLMIVITISVVYVLHQREFRSRTLQALVGE